MSANLKKAGFPTAKDINGDPQLICLDADGRVPVTSEAPGTCFHTDYACFDLTETAGTPNEIQIGEVTINVTKVYKCFEANVSANVDTLWTLKYVDDADGTPAETTLFQWITNPASPNYCCKIECIDLDTTGGTGTQKLRLCATAISADCLGPALGFAAAKEQG